MQLEELITVATFNEWDRAEPLRQRLEDAEIPAQIFDESLTQRIWWFASPKAHIRVRVDKANYEKAKALVLEWDAQDHVLNGAVRCPECGGSRIEFPQFSRRTSLTMAFAFLNILRVIPREYYCRDCHFTWGAEPQAPTPKLDVLNWPIKDAKR